ncbi:hypothetical protein Zm00014a_036201 [Zea mays]|uniref:Uncharacterized protein n=1 Tax=Zea mays TaxID=4577 RepID=A0A3L6DWA0_MAIZE|nr:hypothetical protein Zm00014a_036201 [Zea mays]
MNGATVGTRARDIPAANGNATYWGPLSRGASIRTCVLYINPRQQVKLSPTLCSSSWFLRDTTTTTTMKASAPFSTSQPLSCRTHGGRPSSMSMSAGARTATSVGTSSKRPWFGDLLGRLSSTMDGASRALKDAPQRFLDALVDATFRFTDQALNSAEVGSNPLFGALHSTSSVLGQSREIWVEGEGMLHAVYFTKSSAGHLWSVSYASRYVQSETLELETARHKPCFLPAVEGDSAAIVAAYVFNYLRFGKVSKDISNTNVFEHSGRVFAVAENSLPYEICVGSLDTRDAWDVGGEWDRPFTAHPKVAPGSGELVIFGTDAKKPFLVVGVVSADGTKLKHRADLKLDRCTLCHDIGVTPKYV